jgi:hypothetical protein
VRVYARVCNVPRRYESGCRCSSVMIAPSAWCARPRRWDWGVQINEQNDDARLRNHFLVQQPDPKQFQFLTDGRAGGCLIANGTNLTIDKMSNA